jgi:hypothetical protein
MLLQVAHLTEQRSKVGNGIMDQQHQGRFWDFRGPGRNKNLGPYKSQIIIYARISNIVYLLF